MADQNIVTNITATANFSSLTAQLQAVTQQLLKLQATTIGLNKNLTSQVGVMNRQFDETMRSTGQFSRHFVTLTSDVSKFGQNLDSGRMKLGQYFRTWQGHTQKTSSLVRDLAKQQVMLENAIIQPIGKNAQGLMQYNVMVQSGLDVTKNKSALLRQELAIMNKVMMDGSNQLINWGKNTQWAGRQLTVGLTVPLAAFGMAAAKAFRQADEELVRLTKVYGGLTATSSADLLKVRKDVMALSRELASGLGANFTETIALAADIAATGKEGEDLLNSTRQTTRLAILGEVDRQEAMKATLSIQTAFGQNTMELAESIDFLNAVENQTSTTLEDLVTAIPKPKSENKIEELILKSGIFRKKLEDYVGMGINSVIIEEPLLNSNNVYTVGTLMRFNTLICKEVYDVLGVVPEFLSTYNSRKYAFPHLVQKNDKGKFVLFLII